MYSHRVTASTFVLYEELPVSGQVALMVPKHTGNYRRVCEFPPPGPEVPVMTALPAECLAVRMRLFPPSSGHTPLAKQSATQWIFAEALVTPVRKDSQCHPKEGRIVIMALESF